MAAPESHFKSSPAGVQVPPKPHSGVPLWRASLAQWARRPLFLIITMNIGGQNCGHVLNLTRARIDRMTLPMDCSRHEDPIDGALRAIRVLFNDSGGRNMPRVFTTFAGLLAASERTTAARVAAKAGAGAPLLLGQALEGRVVVAVKVGPAVQGLHRGHGAHRRGGGGGSGLPVC